ncbi:class I adenylate-forming enzyme family protein [Nocardia carnea]|uniref:class I adenylate-forming enzyme family protein n=1 Tax=Nocardia carnea TaxID=37328 RepID=UPI002455AC5A|nr:class I adenylate-forming enzyme family protein [Nocardia carnea]
MPIFNGENVASGGGDPETGRVAQLPASIAALLEPALTVRPDAPAIEAASGVWSYRELDEHADAAAAALWSFGVRPGDRVAACLPNDLDIVAAFHGAQRIGAIWAGIGEAMAGAEQQYLHDLIEPRVVLAGPRCLLDTPARVDTTRWAAAQDAPTAPPVETVFDAPAGIAFTSGTSGRPKAVVHSQRNMLLPGAVLVATRDWGPDLRKGDSFPLTILNMIVLSTLLTAQAGGCAVIMDRRDAAGVAEWIAGRRVTVWNGAPAQLHDLAARPELDLGSLREVWSGGSDTPDRLREAFAAAHGLVPRVTYGLTEAPTVVSIDPPGAEWRPRTSGTVLPHYDVAAYDDRGKRLAPGEIGELRLSARTDGAWANLWRPLLGHWAGGKIEPPPAGPVATGDIGTVDSDGRLTLLDRKKMVIIRGSANIYPLEVERVLDTHPAVGRSAVCGIPHERLGQQVAAVIQTNGAAVDFTELAEHCRRELAGYKVPEVWAAVEALPTNAMGKVVRAQLPDLISRADTA